MKLSKLQRQKAQVSVNKMVNALSGFRIVYTLISLAYCAVHWFFTHKASIYVLSSALIFGITAATAVAWLSSWLSSSET